MFPIAHRESELLGAALRMKYALLEVTMKDTERKTMLRWVVLTAALGICMMLVWVLGRQAQAEPDATQGADGTPSVTQDLDYVNKEEYVDGYFEGEVNEKVSTTVNVRKGPGSDTYEVIKTSAGNSVKIPRGTKVTIIGESKDAALDLWYHVRLEFDGETVEGYCFAEFITRSVKVTFTPTPTPSEDGDQTPTPTLAGADNVFGQGTPTPSEDNKNLVDDSKGFRPYKYMLILCIVIIVLIFIYTVYSKYQEKNLEKEMERYSSRTGLEPLEGEKEEDFEEAKQDYYNYLKLGDQTDRNLGEELGNPDEIELDLNGLFEAEAADTEEIARTVRTTQSAPEPEESLEEAEEEDPADRENAAREAAARRAADREAAAREAAEREQAVREAAERKAAEGAVESASEISLEEPEVRTEPEEDVRIYSSRRSKPAEARPAAPVTPASELSQETETRAVSAHEAAVRARLEQLREQDHIQHKLYGEGEVIDNSDAEIIQIRFGRDLRFLKKEKLARKDLVIFE